MRCSVLAVSLGLVLGAPYVHADVLDPDSESIPVLRDLVEPLRGVGVDILYSHESDLGRDGPSFGDAPRLAPLIGFNAWSDVDVDLDRHRAWLDAFETGARGVVAAVSTGEPGVRMEREAFRDLWREADSEAPRVVITFASADLAVAERVAHVLEIDGYAVYLAIADPDKEVLDPAILGKMFIAADHVFAIDTASARLNPVIQFEAELLAELRRQRAWVASGDDGLPPVRRGPMDVIESLGALPMKVVPGGIVLGMKPSLDKELAGAGLAVEGSDYGIQVGEQRYVAEQVSTETREAIAAFVLLPDSHSVVDIVGGDVTLVTPFQDTRIGSRMIAADKMPFDHLSVRGAQKSVIVDKAMRVRRRTDDQVAVDVTLEVRFYRRDGDGHADRLAALEFTVEDATGSARLLDLRWTRQPDSRIAFDGEGIGELVDELESLALDAAIIGLARL